MAEARVIESELWRWSYTNEAMYAALKGSERYTAVIYDAFSVDSGAGLRTAFYLNCVLIAT